MKPPRRQRLDTLLVDKGLVESREKARALILAGQVDVDGHGAAKAGTMVPVDADVRVIGPDHPWVSRGGIKLAAALDAFAIDPAGQVALDIGASTGGFTDVWLQRGAVNVFLNAREGVAEDMPLLVSRAIGGTNTLFVVIEAETAEAGVDALHAEIADRAKVVMPLKTQFYGMREFAVEDPDGYVIFFAQRVSS